MKNLLPLTFFLLSCTSPDRAHETLEKAGFTEITTLGYDYFACSEDDNFRTKFRAKNPQGVMVEGTVCCGLLKSCTIRF